MLATTRLHRIQSREEGDVIFARLPEGARLVECLNELARIHALHSGVLLGAVGMLSDVRLGFFQKDRGTYDETRLEGAQELVSLQGNIARDPTTGDPAAHLHVQLATQEFRVRGGHLLDATIAMPVEVSVRRLRGVHLERVRDPVTNRAELTVA